MSYAIETAKLCKRYRRTVALENLDLLVPEGAVYVLVGPNGAGKTTLIKVLMNILEPTSGRARILKMDSGGLAGKLLQNVGYVSENQQMPEWMTVGSLLEYLRPFYSQWDRELENQLVRRFDLPRDRKLKHLSRGMRMKAAFAGSLSYRPKMLILDEPLSGLDPMVREDLVEALRTLRRDGSEMTIMLSTHDLGEVEDLGTQVGYLEKGRMLFSEEIAVLRSRFRKVRVLFEGDAKTPEKMPKGWGQLEVSGAEISFVENAYAGESSERAIAELFPEARSIAVEKVPLRSIFLAVAKARQIEAQSSVAATERKDA